MDLNNLPSALKFNELENAVIDQFGNMMPIVEMKTGDRKLVKWERLSSHEVLETGDWVTGEIPVIPIIGGEIHFETQTYRSSLIRWAKDPQRLYNFWRSAQTELIANAPKQPFVVGKSQVEGKLAASWMNSNKGNEGALIYDDSKNATPPQRQSPPQSSIGFMQEIAQASQDMKDVTGIHDAALGAKSNETSGVAISARQRESDISNI